MPKCLGAACKGRPRLFAGSDVVWALRQRTVFDPQNRAVPNTVAPGWIRGRQLQSFIDQSANTGKGGLTEAEMAFGAGVQKPLVLLAKR